MKQTDISVEYIDHMGNDLTVVNAARQSFNKDHKELTDKDKSLLSFLASGYRTNEWEELIDFFVSSNDRNAIETNLLKYKNRAVHWVPFAHPKVQLKCTMPLFLARQFAKHQVGGVVSEMSRRYVKTEPEVYLPQLWHTRPPDIKQGSGEVLEQSDTYNLAAENCIENNIMFYNDMIYSGVAPEEARMILPSNIMTVWTWTGSLAFWARVCNQRMEEHAQLAAQELARKIYNIIDPLFPVSFKLLVPTY